MKTVGIVGKGFVGNAIYENLKSKNLVKIFDIDPVKSLDSLESVLDSDLIFVCLPTPMYEDGTCNTEYIYNFFNQIQTSGILILKSTVPIGTTEKLCILRPDLKIIHNPEFLTAVNATNDFLNADRTVLGGFYDWCEIVKIFLQTQFPNIPIQITTSNESETIKYFSNCFLASKIAFFNNLYETCSKFKLNYETVSTGVCSDKRIGFSHSTVPGSDGKLGFGGYCFPKDINAFINTQKDNDIDSSLLEAVLCYNNKIRI